ncbi:hypothetical protein, partial [Enterobacter hormaechei]
MRYPHPAKKSRRHRLRLFCTRYSDNFWRILEQRFQERLLLSIPFILTVKHLQLLGVAIKKVRRK